MKFYSSKTIRQKLQSLSLFLVLTTAVLGMTTTLAFSLRMEYDNLDRNLMNSALVLAQSPDVADVLAGRSDGEVLTDYLNGTISRVQDIDAIVVADTSGTSLTLNSLKPALQPLPNTSEMNLQTLSKN